MPPALSYPLANFLAKLLARQKNLPLVQSVRSNQQAIHGGQLTSRELQNKVEEVFAYAGRCLADLYHTLKNPAAMQKKIAKNQDFQRLITMSRDKNLGAFFVVPHMSSFDIILLAAAAKGLQGKVLTFGNPSGGYKLQNDIRATSGLEIMPVNKKSNAKSIEALRKGDFIITAIDRPIQKLRQKLNFFGKPAPLPAGYIHMAIEANVPVIVGAVHMNKEGLYQLSLSEPIQMIQMADSKKAIRVNAENILQRVEGHILSHPSQWQMYYPVWPEEQTSETN